MSPDFAELVTCPYCGTKKELMRLASGNTLGASYWSDNKQIAPMLPSVSPVQKCPHCNKYYVKGKQYSEKGDDYSFQLGTLSYPEWKEAYNQFVGQYEQSSRGATDNKPLNKHTIITDQDMVNIRFFMIQAYNDYFHREMVAEPSHDEYLFICQIIKDFINTFDWSSIKTFLLKAEFYREANEMEKCAETLDSLDYNGLKNYEKSIFDGIKTRMEQKDNIVFLLDL